MSRRPTRDSDPLAELGVPFQYLYAEGWGMVSGAYGRVLRPRCIEELRSVVATCGAEGIPMAFRGAGRSYGDASHSDRGVMIDISGVNQILAFDPETGIVDAQAGVTIEQLWKYLLPRSHWPAVVPGTMAPTLAGVTSMNVHGKNNFKVGATGDQIEDLDLLLPNGELITVDRESNERLFRGVVGGLGQLGCITRVRMKTKRVHSGRLKVGALSAGNLAEMMEHMRTWHSDADYLVGWVDCFAAGERTGRGLTHVAWHLKSGEDPHGGETLTVPYQELPSSILGFPKSEVWRPLRVLNRDRGMRWLNGLKHFMGKREAKKDPYLQSHAGFNFLLDYVPNWKFAYGRRPGHGLIQYQPFLPDGVAHDVLVDLLGMCQDAGHVSYLGVLKRHRPDDYLLTHALDGWSLALDFKVHPENRGRLWSLCDAMTQKVLDAGGKFYFAKDLVLGAGATKRFLPPKDLKAFLKLKGEMDPDGLLQTDQTRRVLDPLGDPYDPPLTHF